MTAEDYGKVWSRLPELLDILLDLWRKILECGIKRHDRPESSILGDTTCRRRVIGGGEWEISRKSGGGDR